MGVGAIKASGSERVGWPIGVGGGSSSIMTTSVGRASGRVEAVPPVAVTAPAVVLTVCLPCGFAKGSATAPSQELAECAGERGAALRLTPPFLSEGVGGADRRDAVGKSMGRNGSIISVTNERWEDKW